MKQYDVKEGDTQRLKLLKKCAQRLHDQLKEMVAKPIKEPWKEKMVALDILRLNKRIADAAGEAFDKDDAQMAIFVDAAPDGDEADLVVEPQTEMDLFLKYLADEYSHGFSDDIRRRYEGFKKVKG